jgi:hypothetical protein
MMKKRERKYTNFTPFEEDNISLYSKDSVSSDGSEFEFTVRKFERRQTIVPTIENECGLRRIFS